MQLTIYANAKSRFDFFKFTISRYKKALDYYNNI